MPGDGGVGPRERRSPGLCQYCALCAGRRPACMQYPLHAVMKTHEPRAALQSLRHHLVPLPDALKPGFHCVTTQWIRGFIAFQLTRRTPDRDASGASVT